MSKQKVCTILLILFWYRPNYILGTGVASAERSIKLDSNRTETSPEIRASPTPSVNSMPALDLVKESKTLISRQATTAISTLTLPQQQIVLQHIVSHAQLAQEVEIDVPYVHIIAFEFVGKRFNEKVGYDDLYYWECKVDKLLSMMHDGYSDIDESDIEEIRRNAPELYSKYRRQFEEYIERKMDQPLLFSESGFILYIPEEIARGEKKQEHKEEVVIHLTSDPNLFHKVFRIVPIRERPKVSEASRIRREKQEAEYREQQRIHAEQYKAKEKALRRANGEDMIFDPRVGKRVHFEDYLRSLFLSQLAEPRARNNVSLPSKGRF